MTRLFSFVLVYLFALCMLSACGGDKFETYDAISAEQVVLTSEYPMVVFVALPEGQGLCTGTFIASRAILTAAHCTQANGSYVIFTSFGTYRTSEKMNLSTGELNDTSDMSILVLPENAASWDDGQIAYIGEPANTREKVTLVGFGCDNLKTRLGAGRKRLGQNYINGIGDYIELLTPSTAPSAKAILGPMNRAGSCFGDSGGPIFRMRGETPELVGVSHSGGYRGNDIVSRYVDINRPTNLKFLEDAATRYDLDISPACGLTGQCNQPAMTGIADFLRKVWNGILVLLGL